MCSHSLADERPDLLQYWDYNKNENLDPMQISAHSHEQVWWTCALGHSYKMSVDKKVRSKEAACSVCDGRIIVTGFNDFATLAPPEILDEWCYEFNDIDPSTLSLCSTKKVWWKCKHGHYWNISCDSRITKKSGCPYCSGRNAIPGVNDLYTTHPEIAQDWDYEYNLKQLRLLPGMIKPYSSKKVQWKCPVGHTWLASPATRMSRNTRCPYCDGRKLLPGWNDLATRYPELANEWNYERNGDLLPSDVSLHTNKIVWWRCSEHPEHEWEQSVASRTRALERNKTGEYGCPYCNNRMLLPGFNDLETRYPELATEWDQTKNGVSANEAIAAGKTLYHWKCSICHHEWQTSIRHRIEGHRCPKCNSVNSTSFIEQAIFFYLKRDSANNVHSRIPIALSDGKKYEIDVFIEPNIAIEYDGSYWHNKRDRGDADANKKAMLLKDGYYYISVSDSDVNAVINAHDIRHVKTDLVWMIEQLEEILGIEPIASIDPNGQDQNAIMAQYEITIRKKSIAERNPEKAATWDYDKNFPLEPTCAFPTSNRVFWWKCPKCHKSYQNTVSSHIRAIHDCPHCPHPKPRQFVEYEESVENLFPAAAKCWIANEDDDHRPFNTSPKSKRSPTWKCPKCGHQWNEHIYRVVKDWYKCPHCNTLINSFADLDE